jgi:hypothetical protein
VEGPQGLTGLQGPTGAASTVAGPIGATGAIGGTFAIFKATITTVAAFSILKNATTIQNGTLTGATVGMTVMVSPRDALPAGVVIAYARVSAVNTVEIGFLNKTNNDRAFINIPLYITVL